MRPILATSIAALAATLAIPSSGEAAIVTYTPGDLLLGFHATGGTGANNTYVYNLGSASQIRDATSSFSITSQAGFATLGVDLDATFGAGWFGRTDLFWGAAAVRSSGPFTGPFNGDPTRTDYVTRAAGDGGWFGIGSTDRASAANSIDTFQGAFALNDGTAASNSRGAIIPTSQNNDWSDFNSRSATGPADPSFVAFNPSIEAPVGMSLELFRILNSTAGANPGGPVGDGTLIGTLTTNAGGGVGFDVVPEPSSAAITCLAGGLLGMSGRRRKKSAISLGS